MSLAVSAIIPVYECERCLEHCIKSILNQTLQNFEIILIDDGSTDNSPKICDEFAKNDNRIVVIHKENGGVSAARNEGIKVAKGEYITFIDADDYIDSQMFEKLYQEAKEGSLDLVVSGMQMENWIDDKITQTVKYVIENDKYYTSKELMEECGDKFPIICISGPCCKLYKTEIIKKYKILFNTNLERGEDTCFNFDVLSKVGTILFVKESYYHYRRWNQNSLFSKFRKDIYEIYCVVNEKQLNLMIELNCDKIAIESFKHKQVEMFLGEIHGYYKSYKFNTKQERLEFIEKIANNQRIKECKLRYINGLKNKILVILLKMKKTKIVLNVFENYYKKWIKEDNKLK